MVAVLPSEKNVRLEFRYDEQGRRVEKAVYDRGTDEVSLLQRFIYEGWNLVGTLDVEGEEEQQFAILNTRYVWRTGSEDTGSFGLLMVAGDHDGDPTNLPRAYYPGYDGRGNLTSLAENRQGVAAAAWEYSPFGELLRAEASVELPSPKSLGATFGFATQYTDTETGLVYFGHRYYHPGMGRFLNKDPLGEAGGLNRYAYALNDPINRTDYRGLCYTGPVQTAGWHYLNSFGSMVEVSLTTDVGYVLNSIVDPNGIRTDYNNARDNNSELPYNVLAVDENGNALVQVTDRERFDGLVAEWEASNPGSNAVVPQDQWTLTGSFNMDGSFSLGFRVHAPWEGGTPWYNQATVAAEQRRAAQGGEFTLRNKSGGPSRSAYLRLNPGDVPELDTLLTSDEAVEGLGRLYLLNKNNGKNGKLVTEYAGTFYETSPMYANELSSTTKNAWGAADGSVRPEITFTRVSDVIGVAHTHWGDQLPTFPTDHAYTRTDLSSNGWWSIVVTRQNIFFVGPSKGQLYYLPASDFINAGRRSGSSVSLEVGP